MSDQLGWEINFFVTAVVALIAVVGLASQVFPMILEHKERKLVRKIMEKYNNE